MSVKLDNIKNCRTITPILMKDGEIGEIIKWGNSIDSIGEIVQRVYDDLIVLGKISDKHYTEGARISDKKYEIRLLENGEKLIINQ